MGDRLRVGVAGGGIGGQHVASFQALPDLFDVTVICDTVEERARHLAEAFGIPRVVTDFESLCRLDDLDVIDICTPSSLHVEQTQQALAAGKHVICEKPVAGSLQGIDTLIKAEAESGQHVMPVFQYRYGHGIQKLKHLQRAGLTGKAYLTTVETSWRRRAEYFAEQPWRGQWQAAWGGVLVTQALHAHDLLCYVLGPVKSVMAHMSTRVNPVEVEDCVAASLEMADGSLATLAATLGSPAQISRHRFCFAGLTAESNTGAYSNSSDPWTFTGDTPEIDAQIEAVLAGFSPLLEGFAGQFYRFYYALTCGKDLPVTLADARASVELLTALYASASTGQAVTLPIGTDHPRYAGWQPVPPTR
ncbi:MAG: Gfo/Idh/MocA family oxidoreductase [Anaerolineae bacterium]|nr:Gfo/Idh/MocA family oxidoreductase [Anaerolineae bacterium]